MESKTARRTLFFVVALFAGIGLVAYLVSFLIRGYRPQPGGGISLQATGLLAADSKPEGASVYLDDKLITATNDSLNLPPGEYQVRIEKDGFLPWQKELKIKKEVVIQTNTVLFKSAPDLKPLTNTGAINPVLSPEGSRIVYAVNTASARKNNGIWVLDLSSGLPLSRANVRQLTDLPIGDNETTFEWSPDGKQILITLGKQGNYLVSIDQFIDSDQLADVSLQLKTILTGWEEEREMDLVTKLAKLPEQMEAIASQSADLIQFSSDGEKMVYLATDSVAIPEDLIPHPPARSTQVEDRNLKPGNIYCFDSKEDTNFLLGSADQMKNIRWLTERHLVYIDQEKNEVKVLEADNSNRLSVYSGPFDNGFVFPSPSGKSLITLTSLHPGSSGNLYEVVIR
ncbi:MAG: PEGA domain-containing protein [Patescibacteria group bacterium]